MPVFVFSKGVCFFHFKVDIMKGTCLYWPHSTSAK